MEPPPSNIFGSLAMQRDRAPILRGKLVLPLEVWEVVIDWVAVSAEHMHDCSAVVARVPENDNQTPSTNGAHALLACAITCKAWLPKSRYQLYKNYVVLCGASQCRLFTRTITAHLSLAALVRKLTMVGSDMSLCSWINSVPSRLGCHLPNVTSLALILEQRVEFTPSFYASLSMFHSVTDVRLRLRCGQSYGRLIRALPSINEVHVQLVEVVRTLPNNHPPLVIVSPPSALMSMTLNLQMLPHVTTSRPALRVILDLKLNLQINYPVMRETALLFIGHMISQPIPLVCLHAMKCMAEYIESFERSVSSACSSKVHLLDTRDDRLLAIVHRPSIV